MKHFIQLFLLLFLLSFTSRGQYASYSYQYKQEPKVKSNVDESLQKNIFCQAQKFNLNQDETQMLYWMNFARKHPKEFYNEVVVLYLNTFPELAKQKKYIGSLKKELYSINPLKALVLDEKLMKMARVHTKDIKEHNNTSAAHASTNGLGFQERVNDAGINVCVGENLSYGASSALMQLVLLYLDINLPNLGHRKTLLDPNYSNIGISSIILNNGETFFVQDFSCSEGGK